MARLRRHFGTERQERAPGRFDRVHFLKCGHPGCSIKDFVFFRSGLGTPDEAVYKKFLQKDWYVDMDDPSADRCRMHKPGRAAIRIVTNNAPTPDKPFARLLPPTAVVVPATMPKQSETAMSLPAPTTTSAAPPMETRRLIFARLHEVYVDEKTGYSAQWSDEAVAKDMGVQLEWVRSIRAENFGPLNINGELVTLIAKARQYSDEAWAAIEELKKVSPIVQKALGLRTELEKLDARLAEITGKNPIHPILKV